MFASETELRTNRWTDGQTNRRTDRRSDYQMPPVDLSGKGHKNRILLMINLILLIVYHIGVHNNNSRVMFRVGISSIEPAKISQLVYLSCRLQLLRNIDDPGENVPAVTPAVPSVQPRPVFIGLHSG